MNRLLLLFGLTLVFLVPGAAQNPRVFIFTDINIDAGDPDDRQSLIHLLWYADELKIEGIVPDRWNAMGLEACNLAIDAYAEDYRNFSFKKKNYPEPEYLRNIVAKNAEEAYELFYSAVSADSSPLYVLVWGNMELFSKILLKRPEYSGNIRLITIGTGLMPEDDIKSMPASWTKSEPCVQLNWNGQGRNSIYNNPLFDKMWWLEINWTYAGMFKGDEPKAMFSRLSIYGSLGKHIKDVVKNESWAQYFRVGDTPSVLYLLDRGHDPDSPGQSSWAGKFTRPFPRAKPNYYTDYCGNYEWDYLNPCITWKNHRLIIDVAAKTLTDRRAEMYDALLEKLNLVYKGE